MVKFPRAPGRNWGVPGGGQVGCVAVARTPARAPKGLGSKLELLARAGAGYGGGATYGRCMPVRIPANTNDPPFELNIKENYCDCHAMAVKCHCVTGLYMQL